MKPQSSSTTSFSSSSSTPTSSSSDAACWSLPGLKKETDRALYRVQKKLASGNSNPELSQRLAQLNELSNLLAGSKSSSSVPPAAIALATSLSLSSSPPPPVEHVRRPKVAPPPPRLPYRTYKSSTGHLLYSGKTSADNDYVSAGPFPLRSPDDLWLHAFGHAGSHVVVSNSKDLSVSSPACREAALLAAFHSKGRGANVVEVTVTRCRSVRKPPLFQPGMVLLTGVLGKVTVDLRREEGTLQALNDTMSLN